MSQGVDDSEIAIAYGRRELPKLLTFLARPNISAADTLRCLAALISCLNTQEQKVEAISLSACMILVVQLRSERVDVAKCACEALIKLVPLMSARDALAAAGGIEALVKLLRKAPLVATRCLLEVASSQQGAQILLRAPVDVIASLVGASKVRTIACNTWRPSADERLLTC